MLVCITWELSAHLIILFVSLAMPDIRREMPMGDSAAAAVDAAFFVGWTSGAVT